MHSRMNVFKEIMAIMKGKCIHLRETRREDDRFVIGPSDWIHIYRELKKVLALPPTVRAGKPPSESILDESCNYFA